MSIIVKYLKIYKKEVILGPFFKLLEAIFDLLVPIVVAKIIDNGIANSDYSYVLNKSLLLILLAIFGIIVSAIAQFFSAKAAIGIGTELRENLFKHIQTFSFKNLDSIGESTLINRLTNDSYLVQNGINQLLRLLLRSPFIVFGSLIMAFMIDYKMGIIFAIVVPIIFMIVFIITNICIPRYNKIQEKKDTLFKIINENLSGARVIKAFEMEQNEESEFESENIEYTKFENNTSKISSCMNSLNYVVINFGIIAIISLGGKEVFLGNLTQGNVIALYNYMTQAFIELVKLTNMLLIVPKAFVSAKRIEQVFNIENKMKSGDKTIDEDDINLSFENVSLNYSDANDTLSNISFNIKANESVGIIGGTASGKTSLVNLIPRFYDPTSGEVKINGINIKEYDINNLRNNIGIVMQNKVIFSGTIKENIEYGSNSKLDDKTIEETIQISQSAEFVNSKNDKLNTLLEEGGKNLSGGQKQRLAIARVLARNPKILILDDSMSALDLLTDKKLRNELSKIKKDKILIIVSQRISTIKSMDKILVMDEGKLVAVGNHYELLDNCEVYREIYNSQLRKEAI